MRPTALALAALLAAAPAHGQSAAGLWRTQPSDTGAYLHVRIGPCGDRLCGRVDEVFGAGPSAPNIVGRTMISNMAPDGPGAWSGGTIWAPDDDKTYRSRMSLVGDGLKVEGCVLVVCRGQTWTRVD